jgi:hypothetical protein
VGRDNLTEYFEFLFVFLQSHLTGHNRKALHYQIFLSVHDLIGRGSLGYKNYLKSYSMEERLGNTGHS